MESLSVIRELAAKQSGGEAGGIDVDVPVDLLGIDSLGFLEFLFELEDEVGFPIPQPDVVGVKTLRELSIVVDRLSSGAAKPAPSA
jgi:acyl carrier protein